MADGPRLIASGQNAAEKIAKILPGSGTILVNSSLGAIRLVPGTVFSQNKMLVWPTMMTVYYSVDDRLYECPTSTFITGEYLNALGEGAGRASHMVVLAKAEVALLMGIFVPWYGMLGLTAGKLGFIYSRNKPLFDKAIEKAPEAIKLLQQIRARNPVLFNKLAVTTAKEIITNLPSGISAEDVAFFIGRVVRGIGLLGPEATLPAVARVVAVTAAVVGSLHAPAMAAHGIAAAATKQADALMNQLAVNGIHVSREEAASIIREIRSDPGGIDKLRELDAVCRELAPVLNQLATAIHD